MSDTAERNAIQRRFWNAEANTFDAIYSGKSAPLNRFLNWYFRRDMYERYEFTLKYAEPIAGRAFLDVGCGSGRYSVALAERGARLVYGLDVSESMLELASQAARDAGVDDKVEWICGDITAYAGTPVDVCIGIGLFDYVADPTSLLRSMAAVTSGNVIASFPRSNTWRAPIRKVRLALRGCPVYFYSRTRLERILKEAGLQPLVFQKVGKLYCVVANPVRPNGGARDESNSR